ncbi:glutathione S-transferase family protein [Chthonobacter rhizosphaerae]|uniref:glutathione S-transferase family protein n=1 Tax=Chthonobacter rhizosphaerae TaxID=2735553 RepID=UPI0015EF67E1|nr:glutathione S-transferase [Chthonobacter rhizosphaerae]
MASQDITLYGVTLSGHSHRVRLMLRALGLSFRFVEADPSMRRSPEYLAMNPLGQVPVMRDGDVVLADSNAILVWLVNTRAPRSRWLPNDPLGAANVQRWLSLSAGELRYGPALARVSKVFGAPIDEAAATANARRLLTFMDGHLDGREYLAADHLTIADVAMHTYVAHAPEGGISLEPYPNVRRWLGRVAVEPWFEPMPASPVPELA